MAAWDAQSGSGIRFEWGPAGASRLASEVACLVAVDVLSFTTAVSVAVGKGIRVLPFWWPAGAAPEVERTGAAKAAAVYARQSGARLAVDRHAVTPASPWSLSPAHLRVAPFVARLVLPSPNGASIAAATPPGVQLVAACLRNTTAVGSWLTSRGYGTPQRPVAVIAAGEQWPDGGLRPALEDLLGAGAVISDLYAQGAGPLSAEAAAAKGSYEGTADIAGAVALSASGRRLAGGGFVEDVAIAAEEDACTVVPVRNGDGAFASG
ncbi:2-phosphosulfolactate phosphatase [Streptomyces luteolifulvus]|uniref:Probable 2-phosphosulfolactate phosphatase n=1 Tax=Streptomyces luteolifulvus TaxID=2615112 RepID=A0A6H9V4A9_9ACTN|nr:2-phosphosulfolactate phosphatase [Streptomyces luteolifulvus]KAB1149906.1 2-phosphosulfolactate phosphatase [Streptomyces luteolifulvus]